MIPIIGGLGDALSGVFGFNNPVYGFGLTLTLPIRDRNAAANLADAVVQRRIDTLRVRSVEENIRLQVLNAISLVEGSRESVRMTQQENYERALRDLELEFAKSSTTLRTNTADEAAAQAQRSAGTTRLIDRLRSFTIALGVGFPWQNPDACKCVLLCDRKFIVSRRCRSSLSRVCK